MAYVVCEPCHDCKYTDCVTVCPCDCFYQDEAMLYIDPDDLHRLRGVRPRVPGGGDLPRHAGVPPPWTQFIQLNCDRVAALKESGHITERQEPKEGPGCRGRRQA